MAETAAEEIGRCVYGSDSVLVLGRTLLEISKFGSFGGFLGGSRFGFGSKNEFCNGVMFGFSGF